MWVDLQRDSLVELFSYGWICSLIHWWNYTHIGGFAACFILGIVIIILTKTILLIVDTWTISLIVNINSYSVDRKYKDLLRS